MDNINDFQVNSKRWLSLEDFDGEIWCPVEEKIGEYFVSNLGRIKSKEKTLQWFARGNHIHHYKPHIITAHDNGHGYLVVTLSGKRYYVHRLVGAAFIPNPQSKPDIDHINTIKSDNRAVNLRWVTKSENMRNELTRKSNKLAHADPVIALDYYGNYVAEYSSAEDAATHLGVASSVVKDAIRGNRSARMAKGFQFVRKSDYVSKTKPINLLKKSRTKESVPTHKTVVLLDGNGHIRVVYSSTIVASEYLNLTFSCIAQRCRGNRKVCGYTWYYLKDLPTDKQEEVIEIFANNKSDLNGFVWKRQ